VFCLYIHTNPGPQPPPSPRSGHSATLVGRDHLVIFGGLHTKKFIGDTVVGRGWVVGTHSTPGASD
jgi:hypothetical protein